MRLFDSVGFSGSWARLGVAAVTLFVARPAGATEPAATSPREGPAIVKPAEHKVGRLIEDVEFELSRVLPAQCDVEVELCWEPPWSPERMSQGAKRFMQW